MYFANPSQPGSVTEFKRLPGRREEFAEFYVNWQGQRLCD